MDNNSASVDLSLAELAAAAMDAVLRTDGVSNMVTVPGAGAKALERQGVKGVRPAKSKEGLIFDVYLDVKYGCKIPDAAWNIQENVKRQIEELNNEKLYQVNMHIMGVNFNGREKMQ